MTTAVMAPTALKVKRTELLQLLGKVSKAARSPGKKFPALIQLEAHADGFLCATAHHGASQMWVRAGIQTDVASGFTAWLPAVQTVSLLGLLTGDEVSVTWQESTLAATFKAGDDEITVHGVTSNLRPSPPANECVPLVSIGRADLTEISSAVGCCAGKTDLHPWWYSICFEVGEHLRATSTNGVRIGRWEKPATVHRAGKVVVNPDAVRWAAELATPGETILLSVDGDVIRFSGHAFDVWTQQVVIPAKEGRGEYPDVMRLVPTEYPIKATVGRQSLIGACRLGMIAGKDGAVKFSLGATGIQAESHCPEVVRVRRWMPGTIEMPEATELALGINGSLVTKPLDYLQGPEVRLEISNARQPVRLVSDASPHLVYVVLPLITF